MVGGEGAAARLAIGVPDYDAYVAHVRAHHPDATPMTREAFATNACRRATAEDVRAAVDVSAA